MHKQWVACMLWNILWISKSSNSPKLLRIAIFTSHDHLKCMISNVPGYHGNELSYHLYINIIVRHSDQVYTPFIQLWYNSCVLAADNSNISHKGAQFGQNHTFYPFFQAYPLWALVTMATTNENIILLYLCIYDRCILWVHPTIRLHPQIQPSITNCQIVMTLVWPWGDLDLYLVYQK